VFKCGTYPPLTHAHTLSLSLYSPLFFQTHNPKPYDCGFFLTHSLSILTSVFRNPNATYLSTASGPGPLIPSPLNIGIENSRRFRALPVYTVLLAHGRSGLSAMFARQVRLARLIATFVHAHPGYELLPRPALPLDLQQVGIIVLFRAADGEINKSLVAQINRSRRIYVSGTLWEDRPAARFAISTWKVDEESDIAVIKEVLESALTHTE
jgi:glutamate/tyrosine decarboxylase-like PLP-dependent enzyme